MVIDRRASENSKSVAPFATQIMRLQVHSRALGSNIKIAAHLRVTISLPHLSPSFSLSLNLFLCFSLSLSYVRSQCYTVKVAIQNAAFPIRNPRRFLR